MATFEYSSLTASGRLMKGTIEAISPEQAHELLSQMNLTVNEISRAKHKKPKTAIGRSEFLLFNQQLASITKAGIPLERSLRELAKDASSASMRKLINDIADELDAGVSIDEAIEKRQKFFPPLYGRILEAGLKTGRLSEMLMTLNHHLEMNVQTRRIIFEALCYPAVVVAVTITIAVGIFLYIIPAFGEIFSDLGDGARLPFLTQFCLDTAKNIVPILIVAALVTACVVLLLMSLSLTPVGRRFRESIFLKIPILGKLHHRSALGRMAEAMAILVSAGCTMPQCLRLSSAAAGSEKLCFESDILACQVEQGANLMEAAYSSRMIPRLFLYSVQLGAQRNELQDNLHSLSDMYIRQGRTFQARLQVLLLPLMIVFLGMFVGTIVLAMFLPMVSIITAMM